MFLLYIIYQKKSPSFTVHNPGFYPFFLCPFSRNPSSCCVHFIGYILTQTVFPTQWLALSRFLQQFLFLVMFSSRYLPKRFPFCRKQLTLHIPQRLQKSSPFHIRQGHNMNIFLNQSSSFGIPIQDSQAK